jgi:hypothetical protein
MLTLLEFLTALPEEVFQVFIQKIEEFYFEF